MSKRLTIILAVVMALGTLAVPALAQDQTSDSGDVVVDGVGHLWARGKGLAVLHGGGKVEMALDGRAVIKDLKGDMTVVIFDRDEAGNAIDDTARTLEQDGTTIVLEDFYGVILIRGSGFEIEARGHMKFHAVGRGSVFLKGEGTWRTRGAGGRWSPHGIRIHYVG